MTDAQLQREFQAAIHVAEVQGSPASGNSGRPDGQGPSSLDAIDASLPLTKSMICIWHIKKNILSYAKPMFKLNFTDIIDERHSHIADHPQASSVSFQ